MKNFNWRLFRCIWRDKVDMLFWLAIIFFFVYSLFDHNVSGVLVVVAFYLYNAMYRLATFWQDRRKMYERLKELGEDVDAILRQKDY